MVGIRGLKGFLCGSAGKESSCNVGDLVSIPGLGRSPGEGNGNPLQYSCLENPMDRGAWWATVHGVANTSEWLTLSFLSESEGHPEVKAWGLLRPVKHIPILGICVVFLIPLYIWELLKALILPCVSFHNLFLPVFSLRLLFILSFVLCPRQLGKISEPLNAFSKNHFTPWESAESGKTKINILPDELRSRATIHWE